MSHNNAVVANVTCLPEHLARAAQVLTKSEYLRSVQAKAASASVFRSRRNVVVSAPTNSGKTLIGSLVLCDALAKGQRAVLIEPLRALAHERGHEFRSKQQELGVALGASVKVSVSTGDYRLEGECLSSPAPESELVIATPERLDALMRSPEHRSWFEHVGAVVVDEAHLLADPHRGPTLEMLLTSLLLLPSPPRLVLLSATLSNTERLAKWLAPCDVIEDPTRSSPLEKWVLALDEVEDATDQVASWLVNELQEKGAQALVFIHQARHTVSTARRLSQSLGSLAGELGALSYHAQMSSSQREQARCDFEAGRSKVLVTTSALAMGVNLPATHVVIRDLTHVGGRSPGALDLIQMMGRAGRGSLPGKAVVIHQPRDAWHLTQLLESLRTERLPQMRSAFEHSMRSDPNGPANDTVRAVAALLSRSGAHGASVAQLGKVFSHSLGGQAISDHVPDALNWMEERRLSFLDPDTQNYRLTRLGEAAVRAVMPLDAAAGMAQFIRDLMSLDDDDQTLNRWTPIDHLIVLDLLQCISPTQRRYSQEMAEQVIRWCESHPNLVPMIYRRWLTGQEGHSQAAEVLGSLGIDVPQQVLGADEWCRRRGVVATFHSIVLYERAKGRSAIDLSRQFGLSDLDGTEEKWRDTTMWLLSGLIRLLEVPVFFFHLKESCQATDDRVKQIKRYLNAMRWSAFELRDQLKWASPLGAFMVAARRRGGEGIGVESIRKLESAGITQIQRIATMSPAEFATVGIRKDIAKRLQTEAKRLFV
ncbi:DEAD/DEAH box helicase [Aquabacterium sp.]|uniref:DEAD/DEAH box helicase n=1 Tax=Aquabacterium sp. TaxID=1872578 RepID=UPI003BB1DB89